MEATDTITIARCVASTGDFQTRHLLCIFLAVRNATVLHVADILLLVSAGEATSIIAYCCYSRVNIILSLTLIEIDLILINIDPDVIGLGLPVSTAASMNIFLYTSTPVVNLTTEAACSVVWLTSRVSIVYKEKHLLQSWALGDARTRRCRSRFFYFPFEHCLAGWLRECFKLLVGRLELVRLVLEFHNCVVSTAAKTATSRRTS
jgi:hypothetical protein